MSNVTAMQQRRSIRSEAIVSTSVEPITRFASEDHLEAIALALRDSEKIGGEGGDLYFVVSMVKDLWDSLKKEGIKNLKFTKKDLVIWTILEIIDTEVSFEELYDWMAHEPTLVEIMRGDDTTSMYSLLKISGSDLAWKRYQNLLKNNL